MTLRFLPVLTLSLVLPFFGLCQKGTLHPKVDYAVIAYYMDHGEDVSMYPVEKLTHIIYSFLHLEGNQLAVKSHDSAAIVRLNALKQRNPHLKVIISLGGWNGCRTCPDVFSTPEGRTEFASSVKTITEKFKVDGLDLDWEYPAIASAPDFPFYPEDKANFTQLIRELRTELGDDFELSFAAGGFKEFLDKSIEWEQVMPLLNYVNMMTYDIVNGYSKTTGHHTSLFSTPQQPTSVDYVVRYLDSIGVPASKIVIGAAFYGRVFKEVTAINQGLYQSGTFADYVNFRNQETYLGPGSGYQTYWDDQAKAPYAYNPEKKFFATYDNKKSVELKARYVKEKKLGGIMFWSLNGDLHQDGLLDVIYRVKTEK